MSKITSQISLVFMLLFSTIQSSASGSDANTFNHHSFDLQLKKYVNSTGVVNYKGWKKEEAQLDAYLLKITNTTVDEKTWAKNEQLAFWINAYNAFTIKLILKNYPLKSIRDLTAPWKSQFFSIGGKKMSLNDIEHKILRVKFQEPRIHFAIVCASFSCPILRNEAYTGDKVKTQLAEQTKAFINDPNRNNIKEKKIKISEIFNWFKDDFTKNGGTVIQFINEYSTVKVKSGAKTSYLPYNWNLNE